ncbi:MAG TPA: hypothetical protein VM122_12815 [Usitatibacter sp.]|nr:hypothetical protein [Usitatibacter sp.]
MDFKNEYPEYAVIEQHIRRARIERSVAVSHALIAAGESIVRGLKRLAASLGSNLEAERDRRAVEADAFLKRSVPRY